MRTLKLHAGWLVLPAAVAAVHLAVLIGIACGPNPDVTPFEVYTQIGYILNERLEGGVR